MQRRGQEAHLENGDDGLSELVLDVGRHIVRRQSRVAPIEQPLPHLHSIPIAP